MESLTFTTTIKGNLGVINAPAEVISGDASVSVSNEVGASSTVIETVAVDKDLLVGFYLLSDKNMTVTTNAGADTFNLVANKPFWWHGAAGSSVLAADIVTLHFVNAGLTVANVKAEFLLTVAS